MCCVFNKREITFKKRRQYINNVWTPFQISNLEQAQAQEHCMDSLSKPWHTNPEQAQAQNWNQQKSNHP